MTPVPAEIGYAKTFKFTTPDSSRIGSVALVRPGATTHAFDMEQRLIGLSFTKGAGKSLQVTAPPNSYVAPPGYHMLFLVNQSGVPSIAQFVHLSATSRNRPPHGTIASPARDVVIHPGESVDFAGSATDPDGTVTGYSWVFPRGTPSGSTMQTPGAVRFDEPGIYVGSMTVMDDLGVNDPSPPTRRVVVKPWLA